ncbi:hypothetical protein ACFX13_032770 [Malus domestica]|uniref:Uncharacterized protein n=1 Tax=Malus domestica TaxID=3750 RepID=A0A498JYG8_MALDO|nr:hypothetical protein DVH24_001164 [Malus domestica]
MVASKLDEDEKEDAKEGADGGDVEKGFKTSALDAIDITLSPFYRKSLTKEDRGDALVKRVKMKLSMNRKARVDSVIEDLNSGCGAESREWCFVRYESKKMTKKARKTPECGLNRGVGENGFRVWFQIERGGQ